jgi:hypothetical protein
MSLHFTPRALSESIVGTLHNVYYYTSRWGISVRHFTGQSWRYWEDLPARLRDAKDSPEALDAIISELEKLTSIAPERHARRQALIKEDGFRKKEVVLNEQLLVILGALSDELVPLMLRRLTSESVLPQRAGLVDRHLGTGEQLIEPDFLIMGERQLLMGELKTKADRRSRDTKYDANQLCNYLSLAVKCLDEGREDLPNRFSHLIILPSVELRWFTRGQQWITSLQAGADRHMEFDIETTHMLAQRRKTQRYVTHANRLGELLASIPVYCRSYFDIAKAL